MGSMVCAGRHCAGGAEVLYLDLKATEGDWIPHWVELEHMHDPKAASTVEHSPNKVTPTPTRTYFPIAPLSLGQSFEYMRLWGLYLFKPLLLWFLPTFLFKVHIQ